MASAARAATSWANVEVALGVVPAGFGEHEGHGAEGPARRHQRDAHVGGQGELPEDPPVFLIARARCHQSAGMRGHHRRLAGAYHVVHAARRVRIGRIPLFEQPCVFDLRRIDVGDGETLQALRRGRRGCRRRTSPQSRAPRAAPPPPSVCS